MKIPPAPPRSAALGPNPGVCANGQQPCNAVKLDVGGHIVGYCAELVWPPQLQGRWFRRAGHPGKPHRVEWWDES